MSIDGRSMEDITAVELMWHILGRLEDAPDISQQHTDWTLQDVYDLNATANEVYMDIKHWIQAQEDDNGHAA